MKKYIYRWIIWLTISVYVFFLIRYSVNVPYADDFYAIYGWFLGLDTMSGWWTKFLHFFSLHNEHRLVRNHVVQYVVCFFTETINIKTIIYIGNSSLFFVLLFFRKAIKGSYKLLLFTIITLLLVNLRYAESSFFAMAALENLRLLVFALRALYFATKEWKINHALALVFSVFAIWTQGNALLVLPMISIVYVFQKKYYKCLSSLILLAVFSILYFWGYVSPAWSPPMAENLARLFTQPENWFFPFAFLWNIIGAPAYYFTSVLARFSMPSWCIYIPPVVVWIWFLWYFIYITFWKRYYKKKLLVYCVFTFILLNSLLTSISRIQFWYEVIVTSRYTLYSILFLCCVLLSSYDIRWPILQNKCKHIIGIFILSLAIVINIWFTYFTYTFWLKTNSSQRIEAMRTYQTEWSYPIIVLPSIDEDKKEKIYDSSREESILYTKILDESIEKWYYKISR